MAPELLVFDFDGTLAHRPGMWTQCLLDVLDAELADHGVTFEDLRPHLRDGFPWHRPDIAHPELNEPEAWWQALGDLIDRIYVTVGVAPDHLPTLRARVREHYCDATRFERYHDTVSALELARRAGARTVILSNHVPELEVIVERLGLAGLVDQVLTSARTGVEKPHPEAYRQALGPTPADRAWMIGDNPVADRRGAIDVGMWAALVRHRDADFPDVVSAVRHAVGGPR